MRLRAGRSAVAGGVELDVLGARSAMVSKRVATVGEKRVILAFQLNLSACLDAAARFRFSGARALIIVIKVIECSIHSPPRAGDPRGRRTDPLLRAGVVHARPDARGR